MNRHFKQPPRAVFAGTPDFAVPSLERLCAHAGIDVVAVYTQPDRAAGRGRKARTGPVKQTALSLSLPVFQPTGFGDSEAITAFLALEADLLVVAAYGLLLPRAVIEAPLLSVNVHASLLPRWRGAAPIQRAIMAGDAETGISMMRVVEALDAGPVLMQRAIEIDHTDTGGSVHDKLAVLGAQCLDRTVDDFLADRILDTPQDQTLVTYAAKITAGDRRLDWSQDAAALVRRIRALNPSPVATALFGDTSVKVWDAEAGTLATDRRPGEIVSLTDDAISVATGQGVLRITRLQPPGKRPLSAAEFINGFRSLLVS